MPDKPFASGGPVYGGRRGDDRVPLLVTCDCVLPARQVDALYGPAVERLRARLRGEVDDA